MKVWNATRFLLALVLFYNSINELVSKQYHKQKKSFIE
jgi:hypothetical protein